MDELYRLGPESAWGRPYEDSGPMRLRRGVRFPTTFAARMAFAEAGIRLPAVVASGGGELRLRMHRYGQPGVVQVFGNGIHSGTLVFAPDSYPWDVRRLPLDRALLEKDLTVSFRLDPVSEEVDLPPEAIAAFDWVELAPSKEGRLGLTWSLWLIGLALPLLVYGSLMVSVGRGYWAEAGALITLSVIAMGYRIDPGTVSAALLHLWIAFPIGLLLWVILKIVFRIPSRTARGLSAAFTLALLAHSTVLFGPKHLPPDVRPHLRQLRRIGNEAWTKEMFWEISSSYGKDGRTLALGRYHPEATYIAPYPPWSYFILHFARQILDRPRFLLEYFAMVCAASLLVLVFALTQKLAVDPRAPLFAVALLSIEISTWHHAARAHTPTMFGQSLLLAAIAYLAAYRDQLHRRTVLLGLVGLSLLATLSYGATLFHFVFLVAWLVLLESWERRSPWRLMGATVSGTFVSFVLFYRHYLGAAAPTAGASVFSAEGYRAPARWWLLRNQTRDGLRILGSGAPLWTLLALPAYLRLRDWSSGPAARRLILAWTGATVSLVVLKDPLLFPRLLVQIKDDLFFAPLACVLSGMTLSWLARRGVQGKLAVALLFLVMIFFQINDFLDNATTIAPPDTN